jgi:putative transposase
MRRRKFSREFKLEAVKPVRDRGVAVAQACRDLELAESVLRRWMRETEVDPRHAFPGHGQVKPEQQEIDRLRREVAKLKAAKRKTGRDLLERPRRVSRGMRHEVRLHRDARDGLAAVTAVLGARRLALGLPRLADAQAWPARTRRRADRARSPRELPGQRSDLRRQAGLARCAGRRHRLRSAQDRAADVPAGPSARPRRRGRPSDTGTRNAALASVNLLDRQFEAQQPNQKSIADFTYVWTAEGCLYVTAVIDLFSRRVVGWSMTATMTAQLVTDALVMAIWRRGKPQALLHHSDQGSQYSSAMFQRLTADHGITCSMSRSGNVWDNAAMESFFSSLKAERIARKVYRTRDAARADVFDYIERFDNPRRRHSAIGYVSPIEFEQMAQTG